eukprot:2381991-Amphidinium_carterae.1
MWIEAAVYHLFGSSSSTCHLPVRVHMFSLNAINHGNAGRMLKWRSLTLSSAIAARISSDFTKPFTS